MCLLVYNMQYMNTLYMSPNLTEYATEFDLNFNFAGFTQILIASVVYELYTTGTILVPRAVPR